MVIDSCPIFRAAYVVVLGSLLTIGGLVRAQSSWSDRETRLANEYLSLLVSRPEDVRVVDLLWGLYEKHQATSLLLENVAVQARASRHPSVLMVLGHLQRKSGDLKQAQAVYDEVLQLSPRNPGALRFRAEVALEQGDSATAYRLTKEMAEEIADQDPAKISALIQLGSLALSTGRGDEAVVIWEKAAKLKPSDFDLVRQVAELILRAGFPDRAAAFYSALADQSDPRRRLEALYDLARIHEHADQFQQADAALRQGLGILDFRDGRYADFFRRRVRLHERFGFLQDLGDQLRQAAAVQPPKEQHLRDLVRFYDITVAADEHVQALHDLVKKLPEVDDYRWELVRALLDHEGAGEAAKLLDERLKNDGTDLPALVFLRCEADLRLGDAVAATRRIEKLLNHPSATLEVEKQVLAFAQQRSLDAVIEMILQARVKRDPGRAEAVFELAGFYRARRDVSAADALLRRFTENAATEAERQSRLQDAAAFLASGSDLDSAIMLARQAVSQSAAGREAFLRLADLLAEHGDSEEAISWLEKAWQASATEEDGVDVDERLYSLLLGDEKKQPRRVRGSGGEFQLPDAFTGKGFAGTEEAPEPGSAPPAILARVQNLADPGKATSRELFRAAWWAVRAEQSEAAYAAFRLLQIDPVSGLPRELSLEAERLLLDLALMDRNTALAMRVLRRLMTRDPSQKVRYALRLSELLLEDEQTASAAVAVGLSSERTGWRLAEKPPLPARMATAFLEQQYREVPESDQLLQAITQCYLLQDRKDEALKLWRDAIRRASSGGAAVPLMERFAEMLLRQMKLPEYIEVQLQIVEAETEIKRRREAFKRFLDRLLWAEQGGELLPEILQDRLKRVREALNLNVKRHPFDGFYLEALAQVHEREGDAKKAFAAMKQAYYTSPETPFSLDQLRDAALRVPDMASAIYFQKQIAASAGPKELAAESRRLVEMLEQTFQIAEADRVRRRLESRFSQDAAALEDLADHYRSTGQDEAERRVYEQVARVRPWDARSQFRLALKCLRLADETSAAQYLREICARTASQIHPTVGSAPERLPLPLVEQRPSSATGAALEITSLLDTVPSLKAGEVTALRTFFSLPRREFSELPDEVPLIRLRALEELAKLARNQEVSQRAAWIEECVTGQIARSPLEKLWGLYFAHAGPPFQQELARVMSGGTSMEAQFCRLWLTLRAGGMAEGMQWTEQTGLDAEVMESRKRMLLAVAAMLAELDHFHFEKGDLTLLGTLRSVSVVDILRRLQDQQRYTEALELGESLRLHHSGLAEGFTFSLARIAESAERWDLARYYLRRVVRGPVRPEAYQGTYDPYLFSLSAANRLAISAEEREENLRSAWRRLLASPSSAMTRLRKSAVAGLAGSADTSAEEMKQFITGDFVAARTMGEMRGMLMPQGSSRYEEPMHLRSLWEETREIQARFVQEGMGQVVHQVNDQLMKEWGGVGLSSRSGLEFGEWRLGHLIHRMRSADYPTRLRFLREHLASVDMKLEVSVDTLSELGGRLETAGMSREAIEVYGMLPSRAPANPEYAQWLIRVAETALDTRTGLKFTLQLLLAEPPMKPPQPGDEVLREKHAHFLSLDYDLAELHRLAWLPQITRVLQGRIPKEVPYLRELALLHEKLGQDRLALAAWERMHEAFAANSESGIQPDAESCIHRARLLVKLQQSKAALAALRQVPLNEKLGAIGRDVLQLRADLAADTASWEEFRELMALAVEIKSIECITHLTELSHRHGRSTEALNFLTQAERSLKDDGDRFRLRLELLRLLAHDPSWTPERGRSQVAALLRVKHRDRTAMQHFVEWMKAQAATSNGEAWVRLLRAEARAGVDRPLAALALTALADKSPDSLAEDLSQAWQAVTEGDRICLELGAETLLKQNRPAWAWEACLALQDLPNPRKGGRKLPIMMRVAHALGDRAIVQELFAEIVRMPFPGGAETVAWADVLEECGEVGLARELYEAALSRLDSTHGMQADLSAGWTRHLLRQQDFDEAESYLMRSAWMVPESAAGLIHELYAAWGRLADLQAELKKFHLPGGIEKEVLFLGARSLGLPPPVTVIPSP